MRQGDAGADVEPLGATRELTPTWTQCMQTLKSDIFSSGACPKNPNTFFWGKKGASGSVGYIKKLIMDQKLTGISGFWRFLDFFRNTYVQKNQNIRESVKKFIFSRFHWTKNEWPESDIQKNCLPMMKRNLGSWYQVGINYLLRIFVLP